MGLSSAAAGGVLSRAALLRRETWLRVWVVYRISDAALLIASVVLHHLAGEGDFDKLMGQGVWPEGTALMDQRHAVIVGLLLLVAAAAKSALVPFSGCAGLSRCMEGPTPSGAARLLWGSSVHLGAFLLLRVSPLAGPFWLAAPRRRGLPGIDHGVAFAAFAGRVQPPTSNAALSFASPDPGGAHRRGDRPGTARYVASRAYPGTWLLCGRLQFVRGFRRCCTIILAPWKTPSARGCRS